MLKPKTIHCIYVEKYAYDFMITPFLTGYISEQRNVFYKFLAILKFYKKSVVAIYPSHFENNRKCTTIHLNKNSCLIFKGVAKVQYIWQPQQSRRYIYNVSDNKVTDYNKFVYCVEVFEKRFAMLIIRK